MALYREGKMAGLVHAYSGQEAVAVGICGALGDHDTITSTHRGHGHCIAKGMDIGAMMAENLGRATGSCGGKGGSMHITDVAHGVLGANGIVGGGVGIALGAAFSAARLHRDRVSVCFLGDGAMNQGVVFEAMNMAALWRLPLIIACEYNGFTEYTRSEELIAGDLCARAEAFGVPARDVDGMVLGDVRAAAEEAVARGRAGDGPTFLLARTHRYFGHHVAEFDSGYRREGELEQWQGRDPIDHVSRLLIDMAVAPDALADIDAQVHDEVEAAVRSALDAPLPPPETVTDHVFAEVG